MNEARLYELAHEALLTRWGRSYDNVRNYPDCDFFKNKALVFKIPKVNGLKQTSKFLID